VAPPPTSPGAASEAEAAEAAGAAASVRARFRAGVLAGSSEHLEVDGWQAVVEHAARHADAVALAPSLAASRPELRAQLEEAGCSVVVPDGPDPAGAVADVPLAIVGAELAVAETGSVLIAEHELGDRVVTMLCRRLLQVVPEELIHERLEAAATWLAERGGRAGFASLMTGPSRSADIERSLTIGVQGPDEVDVLVLTGPDGSETVTGGSR
jgi:L-lactate dehydrogenase complex protein LldG